MRATSLRNAWRLPALVSGACIVVWLYIGVVLLGVLQNVALLPVWIVLGSVTVPSAILLLILRARSSTAWGGAEITAKYLTVAACAGGLVSIVIGGTMDALLQPASAAGLVDDRALLLAGFVEEACKLGVVMVLGVPLRRKTMRSGLLLGAAVGLGFAAFEDMGYALSPFLDHTVSTATLVQSAEVQMLRQVLTPLGHPLWSALLGAAIFAGSESGRYRLRPSVLLAYVGVAAAHGAWDGATTLGDRVLGVGGAVAATCIVWALTVTELAVLARIMTNEKRVGVRPNENVGLAASSLRRE